MVWAQRNQFLTVVVALTLIIIHPVFYKFGKVCIGFCNHLFSTMTIFFLITNILLLSFTGCILFYCRVSCSLFNQSLNLIQ